MKSFFDYIKNIFLILIVLQLAPSLISGIKSQYMKLIVPRAQVAVLPISGLLLDSSRYNKYLTKFFEDKSIKAILVKMESPGGAAGTAHAVYNQIMNLKKEFPKPIITLVENSCASGGYYIASATDYIIAPGSALVGSIGAVFPYTFQLKDFIEKYNITYIPLKAGEYKNATNPLVNMTPEEKALLQSVLDSSYQQFTEDVARGRGLSLEKRDEWANGKIFTAQQALKHKLIDELGSAYNAEKVIKDRANIVGEIEWVHTPAPSPMARLLGGQEHDSDSMFSDVAQAFFKQLEQQLCLSHVQ